METLLWSLTRPCPEKWVKTFGDAGIETIHVPLIAIDPVSDFTSLDSALNNLISYDGVVFTSQHAVRLTADRLRVLALSIAVPVYGVGSSTVKQIETEGWEAQTGNHPFSGQGLAHWLGERLTSGSRLLFPKSAATRMAPWHGLKERGIQVDGVDLYRPRPITFEEGNDVRNTIGEDPAWVVFGSPSAVEGWINMWGSTDEAGSRLDPSKACALGNTTKKALERIGIEPGIVPGTPTGAHMCRAIYERLGSQHHEPTG